jgi:NAD(P)H-dependent flavin oxidoreductase YrpB (nitropropane dioxygenase family)
VARSTYRDDVMATFSNDRTALASGEEDKTTRRDHSRGARGFRTRITELFGIEHPIVLGGLQGLGRAPLAASVSEAGGLGLITAGCFPHRDGLEEEIATLRNLTAKPFGVNISLGTRRTMDEFVDCVCESEVRIVFTSGHNPASVVPVLKEHGVTWVHVAPAIRFAHKAVTLGADAVILVGYEAGGHPGLDDIALSVLVRRAADEFDVPVIAAGGISDGESLVAALAWGADGVQIGTRFVLTKESVLHPAVKDALLGATEHDTLMIERSLRRARRVLKTERAEEVLRLEGEGAGFPELRHIIGGEAYLRAILNGELDAGVLSTGQVIGLLDDLPSAGEVVHRMIRESDDVLDRLTRQNADARA